MIRPSDGALIPIAPAIGDNDFGQNAHATMSKSKIDNINYFVFLEGYDMSMGHNLFYKVYNLYGYDTAIYNINAGYYGYFEEQAMLSWLIESLIPRHHNFTVAYYHHPLYPAGPNYEPKYNEVDAKKVLTKIFANLRLNVAFEHHEDLYKISYYLNKTGEKSDYVGSTIYLGGGQWSTPHTEGSFEDIDRPNYIQKREKRNNIWNLDITTREATSYDINGEVIDSLIIKHIID